MQITLQNLSVIRKGKFFFVFLCQILLLVLFPYLRQPGLLVFLRLLVAAAFVSGVYAVSGKRAQWITALALAIPAVVLNTVHAFKPDPKITVPMLVFTILFLVLTLVSLLRAVVGAERVTHDTIYGALSVYLLMAIAWAAAYLLLVTIHPGAIVMDAARHPNHTMDWSDCVFYSFVTLTSQGNGDFVAMTAQARSLSILEAVSGTMYVAILVARLVGLYSSGMSQVNPQAASLSSASERIKKANPADWTEPFPSFHITGNLYYVGSKELTLPSDPRYFVGTYSFRRDDCFGTAIASTQLRKLNIARHKGDFSWL